MSNWVINVNDGQEVLTIDDGLYDVTVSDTFNPFGNYAKAWFDDLEGELFDLFRRGTKVSFQYNSDNTDGFTQRFVGYVVNDLENDADGAEQLEIEAYTFDQFLRGDEVTNDQSGKTIFEALEDVITTDVPPIDWNPSLVEVVDNVELTQSFEGDRVEDFLLEVRQKSTGELFGVTEDLEFFFEPAERTRTRRDIDNSQWFNHDIREESGETKNQVKVSYNDGDNTLIVDDTGDQLKLQDNLGAVGPGQDAASINRPEITNFEDAIDAGERFLEGREATLTGPVSTFELNDATPGQVISIEIEPRGIDTDFRIAENLIRWQSESNELTVVAKKGADDDILIEQSKTLQRVDKRPRDESVIPDRVTDTKPTAELPISVTADGVTADVSRVVNDGRNRIRDGVIEQTEIQSLQVEFSTTDSRPSRSDTDIANVIATDVPTVSTDPQSVTYTASSTESDIQTIGIRDTDRDVLIAVARLESPVDSPSVDFTISIANAGDDKSLFTETGLNLIRDILASTAPSWPQEYAYGSDATDPSETDTSLGVEETRQDLDRVLLKAASTTTTLADVVDISATDPLTVEQNAIRLLQSSFFRDAVNDSTNVDAGFAEDPDAHDGVVHVLENEGDFVETSINIEYDMPEDNFSIRVKTPDDDGPGLTVSVDGDSTTATGECFSVFGYSWIGQDFLDGVSAGQKTLRVEVTSECLDADGDPLPAYLDVINFRDSRFEYTDDDSVDADNQLSGPELFPDLFTKEFDVISTRRDVDFAEVTQNWSNTANAQFIEVASDSNFSDSIRADNTQTVAGSLNTTRELYVRVGFSRHTADDTESPTTGDAGQNIFRHELFGNPDAITKDDIGEANVRAIILAGDAVNSTFAESGLFDSAGNLLTSCRVPEFQKDEHLVISSERLRFDND